MNNIMDLFSVPLYSEQIGILEEEKAEIMGDKKWEGHNTHLIQSSQDNILELDYCKRIKEEIQKHLEIYLSNILDPKYQHYSLRITQSWINIILDGHHHVHRHPNSLVSGVFYVNVSEHDSINFENPNSLFFGQLYVTPDSQNKYNSLTYEHEVEAGDLILFPSWLTHCVTRDFKDFKYPRCSISFNTFPLGLDDNIVFRQGDTGTVRSFGDFVLER